MTKEKDRLSEEALANKRRYNLEYRRNKYKNFLVGLPKEEWEELIKNIAKNKMTRVEFVRIAHKLLKEGKIKKED